MINGHIPDMGYGMELIGVEGKTGWSKVYEGLRDDCQHVIIKNGIRKLIQMKEEELMKKYHGPVCMMRPKAGAKKPD